MNSCVTAPAQKASAKTVVAKSEPISAEEKELKTFLADYEEAWNKEDVNAIMAFYHDNAKIMTGRNRSIVSRAKYTDIMPGKLKQAGSMKFGKPKIKITENRAKVKVTAELSRMSRDVRFCFYMVRENGRWLITKTEY